MPLDWTCETIRLSLFSTEPIKLSNEDWTSLTGQEEAEQEQKGAGRRVFFGPLFGGQLSLGAVANRCDCVLIPLTPPDAKEFIPSVGQWPTTMADFQKATETYLSKVRFPVHRMAFGTTIISSHTDRLDAYKALVTQVKSLNHRPEDLHDLLFRINWPKNSEVDDHLSLNRLCSWQVQQLQQLHISMAEGTGAFINAGAFVLRFEMDHNTDGSRTEAFDADRLLPIYKELTNLALQNAEQGEIQ